MNMTSNRNREINFEKYIWKTLIIYNVFIHLCH